MLKYFFCPIPSIFSLWNLYFVKPFVVGLQVPKMLLIFSIFFLQISSRWLILFTEPFLSHIHVQIKLLQGIFISDFLFQFYYSHLLIFNAFLRYWHTIKFTFLSVQSMICSECTDLRSHHHSPVLEHHLSPYYLCDPYCPSYPHCSPGPRQLLIQIFSLLPFWTILSKWNIVPVPLTFFTQHKVFDVHSC